MRATALLVLTLALILLPGVASAEHCAKAGIDKSTGYCTVPDPP